MAHESKTYTIAAEPRELIGKRSRQLRRQNLIPAVVYGHNMEPQSLQVPQKAFEQTYLRAGSITLVDLTVGDGPLRKVFIHQVQRNPVNGAPTHIDFRAVNLRQEMTVSVPLVLVGESPIVHSGEGLLLHLVEHVTVRTLPSDVPQSIEVDISGLTEVDQAIHVSDVQLPENITLLSSLEDMVVKIAAMPVAEVEEVEEVEGEAAEGAEGETEGETDGESGASADSDEAES